MHYIYKGGQADVGWIVHSMGCGPVVPAVCMKCVSACAGASVVSGQSMVTPAYISFMTRTHPQNPMTTCVHASDPFFDDPLGRYTPTYDSPTRRQVQDTPISFDAPTQTLTSQAHPHSQVL